MKKETSLSFWTVNYFLVIEEFLPKLNSRRNFFLGFHVKHMACHVPSICRVCYISTIFYQYLLFVYHFSCQPSVPFICWKFTSRFLNKSQYDRIIQNVVNFVVLYRYDPSSSRVTLIFPMKNLNILKTKIYILVYSTTPTNRNFFYVLYFSALRQKNCFLNQMKFCYG